jgi:hypothetical protein
MPLESDYHQDYINNCIVLYYSYTSTWDRLIIYANIYLIKDRQYTKYWFLVKKQGNLRERMFDVSGVKDREIPSPNNHEGR